MTDLEQKALGMVNAQFREPWYKTWQDVPQGVFARAILQAADLIETQARENERLRGLLLKAADWLKVAPIESGICCCGDPIDGHDYYNGHSPVDAVQYSAMELHKEIHAALAGDSHDQ